jgi:hypothetical protein
MMWGKNTTFPINPRPELKFGAYPFKSLERDWFSRAILVLFRGLSLSDRNFSS